MALQEQKKPVSLAERQHVFFSPDAGLSSVEGARSIIAAISSRRVVSKLTITHNHLGPAGFTEMFKYLCSNDGRRHQITDMDLHNCGMDDEGLLALSEYIGDNVALQTLLLQQNGFGENLNTLTAFVDAVNTSRIRTLVLSSLNCPTRMASIVHILNRLNSPYLHELALSYNELGSGAASTIASYAASARCRLRTLRLSANHLGYHGVSSVVSAMEHNYSLTSVELYSNYGTDEDEITLEMSQQLGTRKAVLQRRNEQLRKIVEEEALRLLQYSRLLLLGRTDPIPEDPLISSHVIPTELRLHILSFFAPTLTDAQRVRIFNYASTRSTLPRLLPSLAPQGCIRDPASLSFGLSAPRAACNNGQCMGSANSIKCRRENERSAWLTEVGCDTYIPERTSS